MTAAFKISSSVFFQTPPLIMILMVPSGGGARGRPVQTRPRLCGFFVARRRLGRRGGGVWWSRSRPRRAGEAGAPPRYCSAGRRGELLRRAPALRGWQRCARLSVSSEVRFCGVAVELLLVASVLPCR